MSSSRIASARASRRSASSKRSSIAEDRNANLVYLARNAWALTVGAHTYAIGGNTEAARTCAGRALDIQNRTGWRQKRADLILVLE